MALTAFVLLGLSILAVWLPPLPLRVPVPPWLACFAAAVVTGLAAGVLTWPGVLALAVMLACAGASKATRGPASAAFTVVTAGIALALALHRVPGFDNPVHLAGVRISTDGPAFTQYLNFDKAAGGLVLLAFYARRGRPPAALTLGIAATTVAITLGLALGVGHVRVDPKWPAFAVSFLVVNLLFTCVAEEAFFRGLMQEKVAAIAPASLVWACVAVVVSAALFGLAHLGGGPTAALLATVAGLGYATAYATTRRIEAAVLAHFAVNAVHFVGFTYPYLSS